MRLTEQQRAELERREWKLEVECGEFQTWVKITGGCIASLYADGFCTFSGDPTLAAEFLAVAGYQPPSYRLVPERLADRAAREIMALARAHSTSGFKRDAEELQALASALQGKEVEKR